jgi:hypothetical protein
MKQTIIIDSTTVKNTENIINDQRINRSLLRGSFPDKGDEKNPVLEKLFNEGCGSFYNYIDWLGLTKDPNLTILSSQHHYFYDSEDLQNVRTMVNLKQLNHIKQIKDFLHNIYHNMPQKSYFVGCFFDYKNRRGSLLNLFRVQNQLSGESNKLENGITSRIPVLNMMFNIVDSRTNRYMTKRTTTQLLEDAGLKVLDMTELNGLTYFCAQKVKLSQ